MNDGTRNLVDRATTLWGTVLRCIAFEEQCKAKITKLEDNANHLASAIEEMKKEENNPLRSILLGRPSEAVTTWEELHNCRLVFEKKISLSSSDTTNDSRWKIHERATDYARAAVEVLWNEVFEHRNNPIPPSVIVNLVNPTRCSVTTEKRVTFEELRNRWNIALRAKAERLQQGKGRKRLVTRDDAKAWTLVEYSSDSEKSHESDSGNESDDATHENKDQDMSGTSREMKRMKTHHNVEHIWSPASNDGSSLRRLTPEEYVLATATFDQELIKSL